MENIYLYNLLNKKTKKLLYLSFIEFGIIKNDFIDIDPTLIEQIITKIITSNEKDIATTYQGNNKVSFDMLTMYKNKTIATSIKTIKKDNTNAKIYEMSCLKNQITEETKTKDIIKTIVDLFNNRYDCEKHKYNINEFQKLYFEKHRNKIVVLCDKVKKIKLEEIKERTIEKTNGQISFIANNEKYIYTFSNNTLTMTRQNATIIDEYHYENEEIIDIDTKIEKFIIKNTKTKENYMTLKEFETLDPTMTGEDLLTILKTPRLRVLERTIRVTLDNKTIQEIKKNHTTTNRDIRDRKVKEYRKAMLENEWKSNIGNTIMFDKDGFLADGNHRLLAAFEIDEPIAITMWVNIGGERSSSIDTGTKRTLNDKIKYLDYVPIKVRHLYTKEYANMLALYCHFFNSRDKQNTDKGQAELAKEFFETFTKEFEEFASPWEKDKKTYTVSKCKYAKIAPVLLALFNNYLNKVINKEDIKHIVHVLDTCITKGEQDSQIIGLREFIIAKDKTKTGDSYNSLLFKTADQYIKGYKKGIQNQKCKVPKNFPNDIIRLGGDKTIHLKEYVA